MDGPLKETIFTLAAWIAYGGIALYIFVLWIKQRSFKRMVHVLLYEKVQLYPYILWHDKRVSAPQRED